MREWLESLAGPAYAGALMWTILGLIALVVVLVAIRIVRSFTFGTFVAGGRNRRARLAVMDATAVDSQRRLVLVRRDDVEHLILIGGPSDVVVEQNIGMPVKHTAARERGEGANVFVSPRTDRPAPGEPAIPEPPQRRSNPSPRRNEATLPPRPAPSIAPMPMPVRSPPAATVPPAETPSIPLDEQASFQSAAPEERRSTADRESEEQPESVARNVPQPATISEESRPVVSPAPATPAPATNYAAAGAALSGQDRFPPEPEVSPERPRQPPAHDPHDLDDALLRELEVDLGKAEHRREPRLDSEDTDSTLDAEMSRLLGELSGERRRD